ncbi:MAG: radical SAM protein [Gemmatimonadetes bacterium]|nr:radical SAM protein [Gemmatimonadota bacterium]
MPNVLLTQACVRSCPYCFARKHMSASSPDDILAWEDLIYLADFFQMSGEQRFPILGGEPTLHPDFVEMMVYLLARDFHVNVFTSGIMSNRMLESAVAAFDGIPHDRLSFTCNLNDPGRTRTSLAEQESVKRFLAAFGERVVPGFNIYRTDFELDFLFRLINEYGLHRTLRLGVAHPIAGKKNLFITPADLGRVIERLCSYGPLFERLRIKPGFDCGFPLCRFTEEQLGWYYRFTGGHYDFGCAPVIDIGPDMMVWSCFPMSGFHQRSIYEFNSLQEVHDYYQQLHRSIRVEAGGIYEACDACTYREDGLCAGGCVAHSLSRFWQEEPVRMKEMYT